MGCSDRIIDLSKIRQEAKRAKFSDYGGINPRNLAAALQETTDPSAGSKELNFVAFDLSAGKEAKLRLEGKSLKADYGDGAGYKQIGELKSGHLDYPSSPISCGETD